MSAKGQTKVIGNYIMEHIPGEPSISEGAGECAVRLLKGYRDALSRIMNELGVPQPLYPQPVANAYEIARSALGSDKVGAKGGIKMEQFRRKPVVIHAVQWFKNGDHPDDESIPITVEGQDPFLSEGKVVRYFRRPDIDGQQSCAHCGELFHNHGWIDTPEVGHPVCPGDWIITGVKGELYPCKPDIFAMTYEQVV